MGEEAASAAIEGIRISSTDSLNFGGLFLSGCQSNLVVYFRQLRYDHVRTQPTMQQFLNFSHRAKRLVKKNQVTHGEFFLNAIVVVACLRRRVHLLHALLYQETSIGQIFVSTTFVSTNLKQYVLYSTCMNMIYKI